jgi:hypothetical protein
MVEAEEIVIRQVADLVVDGHSAVEVNVLRRMQVGVDMVVNSFLSSLDAKGIAFGPIPPLLRKKRKSLILGTIITISMRSKE